MMHAKGIGEKALLLDLCNWIYKLYHVCIPPTTFIR
jgi:hypothetical protein